MNNSPLRYPGGKSLMTPFFERLIEVNNMENVIYAEPYAGGAGTAINLLLNGTVNSIQINDASIGVYSFWHYLITESERFIRLIRNTEVTLEEWQIQRKIFKTSTTPSLELGFATFFLSRTNRSGILSAGPIGGQDPRKQNNATYKIDCRYNKDTLIPQIQKIITRRDDILVSNKDALTFLQNIDNENTFVYLDPPYYEQGKALYLNYYDHNNHVELANFLREDQVFNWILSYDNVKEIRQIYREFDLYKFDLFYTAQDVKKGSELLTHSNNLILPQPLVIPRSSHDIPIRKIGRRKPVFK